MSATITAYGVGKFVHILAVVVAFGPPLAYPAFSGLAQRAAPRSMAATIGGIRWMDRFLVNPAMIVLLAAGIYLVSKGHFDAGTSWIGVGIAAIVILIVMLNAFLIPASRRALELAERDIAGGDELSPEFRALSRRIEAGRWIATLIVVVTIFFMVVKP